MDIDKALVSSIIHAKRHQFVDPRPEGFPETWNPVWDFVVDHYNERGAIPTFEVIKSKWDVQLTTLPDQLRLLMRRLQSLSNGPRIAFAQFADSSIEPEMVKGAWVQGMAFLVENVRQYGEPPKPSVFCAKFPSLQLDTDPPPIQQVIDRVKERHLYNLVVAAMKDAHGALDKERDPRASLDALQKLVLQAAPFAQRSRDINLADPQAVEERIKAYLELKSLGGVDGIPYWLPGLTKVTRGKHPDELHMVVARQGVGKTWLEVIAAHHDWRAGYTPLFVTKEMGVWQIIRRFDAKYGGVGFGALRSAQLGNLVEDSFFARLRALGGMHPFWVSGDDEGTGTVSSISAKIEQYKPDVVYIDGAYLIQDELGGEKEYQRITNVCRELKRLARRLHICIVISLQFNRSESASKLNADNIANADVAKEADVILGLYQAVDDREAKRMVVKLLKQREGATGEWKCNWNFDTMDFEEITDGSTASSSGDDSSEIPF